MSIFFTIAKKTLRTFVVLGVLGACVGAAALAGVFWWYGRDIADIDEGRLRNYRPFQITRVVSQDGELIGELFRERRTVVRYADIPSHVESAFLAAEDADFYQHEGMDLWGLVRAVLVNLRAGELRQGGSTITQQVVKNFLLTPERSLERKIQELLLAHRLEQTLTKREILELYLNQIYLGHGRYGIEEASRFYFGKGVRDIDLGQAALLATLPKAPGRDSPLQQPERAKRRQAWVLQQMVEHGFAQEDAVRPFADGPLELAGETEREHPDTVADEFVDVARRQLEDEFGTQELPYLGATVVTTVSLPVQRAAREAVKKELIALDKREGYGHGLKVASNKLRTRVEMWDGPLGPGVIVDALIAPIVDADPGLGEGVVARAGAHRIFVSVPPGSRYRDDAVSLAKQFPAGAIVKVRIVSTQDSRLRSRTGGEFSALAEIVAGPQAAIVVADVASGELLAMIGGVDYRAGEFNRAAQAARQPGSAFKPFVYGAALASREFTAATLVADSPEIYEKWRPTNFEADVYRGDIRLREALTHSVNTVAIKLADRVGIAAVKRFAQEAGIVSQLPGDLSVALGTGEVTPMELLGAYLTIARGGSRIPVGVIREIRWPDGRVTKPERATARAFDEDVAFVLTSMMASVVESGTAKRAKALGRPAAGKTGTSAEHHDAWFAGFTPRRAAVAWVGFDRPRPLGRKETGGRAAVPMWLAAMDAADNGAVQSFVPPSTVSVRRIDRKTGLLAAPQQPEDSTLEEYFIGGTEPVDEAPRDGQASADVLLDLYDTGTAQSPQSAQQPSFGQQLGSQPQQPRSDGFAKAPLPSLSELQD